MQSRFRAEIRATEAAVRARGDTEFTLADFDGMPYTTAMIKVHDALLHVVDCLIHCVSHRLGRVTVSSCGASCSPYC